MPAAAETRVYISCADDGDIVALALNGRTGALKIMGKTKAGKVVMPMAASPDRRYLYAAIRSVPYGYASYAIDPDKGLLTHLSTVPAPDSRTTRPPARRWPTGSPRRSARPRSCC